MSSSEISSGPYDLWRASRNINEHRTRKCFRSEIDDSDENAADVVVVSPSGIPVHKWKKLRRRSRERMQSGEKRDITGGPSSSTSSRLDLQKHSRKSKKQEQPTAQIFGADVVPSLSIDVAFVLEQDGRGIGRGFQERVPKPDISVCQSP